MKNKLIIRADDLGLSRGVNLGIKDALSFGLIQSVCLMVNLEESQDGYELIKDSHIELGLHCNFTLGKPISNKVLVPSLLDGDKFKSSSYYRTTKEDTVDYHQASLEVKNQIDRFVKITKAYPAYVDCHSTSTDNLERALADVCKENNLLYLPYPKGQANGKSLIYCEIANDSNLNHSSIDYFEKNKKIILENDLVIAIFHPGYLDMKVMSCSSLNIQRMKDLKILTSQESKEWLEDNQIKLCNFDSFK